jgi:hypothetical protein
MWAAAWPGANESALIAFFFGCREELGPVIR